jgi:hypothetical protein
MATILLLPMVKKRPKSIQWTGVQFFLRKMENLLLDAADVYLG